jgi:soluble lytic murein transglycosylase-like protein
MPHSRLVAIVLLTLASASGHADIYGYVDEQGISHFSAEKSDARYRLLVRGNRFGSLELGPAGRGKQVLATRLMEHPNLKMYEPMLKTASVDFAVELALLKAIMAAESGFNPDAVSPKGAIGLMQVMPTTAERYGLLGDRKKSIEQKLQDPKTNIRLGTRYLADLIKLFPGQQDLVIASYNAGEGAVQQYRNTIPPYPETRSYVELVTQLQQVYQIGSGARKFGASVRSSSANGTKRMHLTIRAPVDDTPAPRSPPALR